MRLKTQRRAIYAAMGLTVLALTGGFTLAATSLPLGGSNPAQQGSQTTTVAAVNGLTWTSTELQELGGNIVNRTCSFGSPCDVSTTPALDCAGGLPGATGCLSGDFVENVTLTTVAATPFSALSIKITLYVTSLGTTYPGATFYYHDNAGNSAETITLAFDIGIAANGPTMVSSVTVIAST